MKKPIAIAVCLLIALPLVAAEGATPIWEPTTITQSGTYRVTRNITSTTPPAINTQADDVAIDLNGFTVRGGISGFGSSGVDLDPSFKIENGTVIGSVFVSPVSSGTAVVRNLVVKNGGIVVTDNTQYAMIENNVIQDATSGILVEVVAAMIRNNIIDRPTQAGIHIEECAAGEIVGNVVTSSQGVGINALDGHCRLSENTVRRSAGNGIEVGFGAAQLEGNLAIGNQGFGVHIRGSQTVYRGNTARGNNGTGCSGSASGGDFCDEGTNNTSHGDNYMPGKM